MTDTNRGTWGTRWGFILAASGSAVGLGNIWKFPYITGENGGGLFVLIYLVCIFLVGLPIMMAEIMIGRAAQKQPVAAFHALAGGRTAWASIGWMGIVAGFVILSYYIVVAGWSMDYALKSIVNFSDPIEAQARLEAKTYRVNTPIDDMIEMLTAERARGSVRDAEFAVRKQVAPHHWENFGVFEGALAAGHDADEARRVLLEDPEIAESVEACAPLVEQLVAARAAVLETHRQELVNMSEREVRDLAEVSRRRQVIAERIGSVFGNLAADGWAATFWAAVVMLITIIIVAAGISAGIERACKILMPTLIGIIIFMVLYGMFQPNFGEALAFVFKPDPSRLQPSGVLEALGHAFFTLSLGMGAMITYGSYQSGREGLGSQSVVIAGLDTGIALLACMMIFPITFSYGQEPSAGPGLVFVSMPLAFAEIGRGGMLLAILFFSLLVFAAITSAISLLEVVCSYFIDERGWKRSRAAWTMGAAVFIFGVPSAWSISSDFAMPSWTPGFGKNFFDTMDYLASNWMLPLGGMLISIYAGWIMPARMRDVQLEGLSPAIVTSWLFLVRFVAPVLVILVLVQKVGLVPLDDWLHGLF